MKKILVVKDPECEVGFNVLCDYCAAIQENLGNEVMVVPIWPSGDVSLIDDTDEIELIMTDLKELVEDYENNKGGTNE